jgi:histone demethylase JARID1
LEAGDFSSGFPIPTVTDPLKANNCPEYLKSGWYLNNMLSLPGSLLSFESPEAARKFSPRVHVGMCFSPLKWVMSLIYCIFVSFLNFSGGKLPDKIQNVIKEVYNYLTKQKVEEHQLYSLCCLHLGEPKVWYSVPGRFAADFETIWKKNLRALNMYAGQPDMHDNLVRIWLLLLLNIVFLSEK